MGSNPYGGSGSMAPLPPAPAGGAQMGMGGGYMNNIYSQPPPAGGNAPNQMQWSNPGFNQQPMMGGHQFNQGGGMNPSGGFNQNYNQRPYNPPMGQSNQPGSFIPNNSMGGGGYNSMSYNGGNAGGYN